jgi:hypothetical protein
MEDIKISNFDMFGKIEKVIEAYSEIVEDLEFLNLLDQLHKKDIDEFLSLIIIKFITDEKFRQVFDGYSVEESNRIVKTLNNEGTENALELVINSIKKTFSFDNAFLNYFLISNSYTINRYENIKKKIKEKPKRSYIPRTKPRSKSMSIGENITITGGIPIFERRIIDSFVKFCVEKLHINDAKIKILFRVIKKNTGGFMKPSKDLINWELVLSSKSTPYENFDIIAHELTHIKQQFYKQLYFKQFDVKGIGWKSEIQNENIFYDFTNYNRIIKKLGSSVYNIRSEGFTEYQNLPWEKEAYHNGRIYPSLFKESEIYNDLLTTSTEINQKLILESM